jgi:hypothetical protein
MEPGVSGEAWLGTPPGKENCVLLQKTGGNGEEMDLSIDQMLIQNGPPAMIEFEAKMNKR